MPGIFTMEFGAIDNAVLHRLLMVFADLDGTPTLTVSWDGAQVGTSTANLPGNAGQD